MWLYSYLFFILIYISAFLRKLQITFLYYFFKILLVYFNVSDVSRKILVKSCCRTCSHVHTYSILHQRRSTFKGNGILTTRAAVIYRARVCQSTSKRLLSKRTASAAFTVKRSRSPKTLTVYTFYQISSSTRGRPSKCRYQYAQLRGYRAVRHIHQRYDTWERKSKIKCASKKVRSVFKLSNEKNLEIKAI